MFQRLFLGSACVLVALAGCGGGVTGSDGGPGSDSGPLVDTGVPPVDTGVPPVDSGPMMDSGTTNGCELGNTYPTLAFALVGQMPALPVGIALAPGRDDFFVVLRRGQVVIVNPTTGVVGATFLDVSSRLGGTPTGMGEWGLLGIAFHPDYVTNGLVYVAYTAAAAGAYEDRVAVAMRATADSATFGSDIFTIPDPASNHNGGQLGFGPDDGYLYYSVGDGGIQYDPMLHGQDHNEALGKIHRFRVGPGIATYEVPADNPFVGGGGLPTIWAYGLRNAWRFSWDRRTHDMYIADVGQDAWEEIDFVPAGMGAGYNFGWSYCEGTHDLCDPSTGACNPNYAGGCASLSGAHAPLTEYTHAGGLMHTGGNASVTGGYVYRGAAIPALRGAYVYADEQTSYFAALRNCSGAPVTPTLLTGLSDADCQNPTTFGEDRAGELFVACYADRSIYRIIAP